MSTTRRAPWAVAVGALATILLPAASAQATTGCRQVSGDYVERPVTGPDCASPVGLCIAATYRGDIRGEAQARATSITPTADTPTTSVQVFTSDSTITGKVAGRSGALIVNHADAFSSTGGGPIVDLQAIVGGTGRLTGATGALRAQGTFTARRTGRAATAR
jgi:hypothetical protein